MTSAPLGQAGGDYKPIAALVAWLREPDAAGVAAELGAVEAGAGARAAWTNSAPHTVHRVIVVGASLSQAKGYRGVLAARDIAVGEVVLSIPARI
jgi:hypothetical protein